MQNMLKLQEKAIDSEIYLHSYLYLISKIKQLRDKPTSMGTTARWFTEIVSLSVSECF